MDIRDAYFGELYARCGRDPATLVIVGDFDAHWLNRIRQDFPAQYLNAGIAEQNMIGVAAGLALEGRRPFVCGQNNFITLRAMEQIAVDLCQQHLPVTLVGVGCGFSFSIDGPTHHGVTDLGMMMQLPITIYNVNDEQTAKSCAQFAGAGPAYMRLCKGEFADFAPRTGSPIVVTSGALIAECAKAVEGTDAGLLNIARVHPLRILPVRSPVVVVEDNMGAPIAKALAGLGFEIKASLCPQKYLFEYGTEADMLRHAGLDAESIRKAIYE
jgi:transketolase